MTSKLRCPFCGKELTEYPVWGFGCGNTNCACSEGVVGSEQLWQALIKSHESLVLSEQSADREIHRLRDLLSQSQKDLEIARKAMREIRDCKSAGFIMPWEIIADEALEQIEHKE